MARYKPIDMVHYYRGKICSHSDTYFQKRRKTLCPGRICNPRTKPFTEAELARKPNSSRLYKPLLRFPKSRLNNTNRISKNKHATPTSVTT